MEATREIYWNIGHSVVLPMYLLSFAAVAVLVWGFWKRLPLYRTGRPLNRTDRYEERVRQLIDDVIGQEKVSRVRAGGLPHNLFFWGFMTLFAGTLLVMVQADFFTPLMGVNILSGEFYKAFSLIMDIAGLVVMVMLAALFVRRYFIKPEGLESKDEDFIIHMLLFAIICTGFLLEGARMAATEIIQNPSLANYSPLGKLFAQLFMGFDEPSIRSSHTVFWWIHLALVLGFSAAAAVRSGTLSRLLLIPLYPLMHISNGWGLLCGLFGGKRGRSFTCDSADISVRRVKEFGQSTW